jgi:hypothetical protein
VGRRRRARRQFYPADVIKSFEAGRTLDSMVGPVHMRGADHQMVRPDVIVRGKAAKDMKNKEDFWEVTEIDPGAPLMQKPDAFGCNPGSYTRRGICGVRSDPPGFRRECADRVIENHIKGIKGFSE